ncbi:MAG: LysR family transcriptional regulator [Clostridia bacterium]|nr:LysR family transcriptional regulator [Clostridia bacterium]
MITFGYDNVEIIWKVLYNNFGDIMGTDIDLNLYKVFYSVATTSNITKAAEQLYISQPAVTKSIKQLENSLGGALFIRTKKGVILTEEGKILFEYVKNILEEAKNAQNKFNSLIQLEEGKIHIGASATVSKHFLMPYLEEFHRLYPNIDIEITNELTPNLIKDLRNGYIDFLVTNLPMKEYLDLDVKVCAKLHDSFACSEKYLPKEDKEYKIEELLKYKTITQKEPSNTRAFLNKYMKNNGIEFKPDIEIVSYNLVVEFIKAGFGIGYVTKEFIKQELKNKELYEVKVTPKIPTRDLGIITLKNNTLSYAASKFIDIILKDVE